eukprot:1107-Heterococcus_DN1.PRE.4
MHAVATATHCVGSDSVSYRVANKKTLAVRSAMLQSHCHGCSSAYKQSSTAVPTAVVPRLHNFQEAQQEQQPHYMHVAPCSLYKNCVMLLMNALQAATAAN